MPSSTTVPTPPDVALTENTPPAQNQETVHGRCAFVVDMTVSGLSVRTAFLTDQNQIIEMPAIFPDVHYALAQIDDLRRIVMERFAQAAHIGAQVIAAQVAEQARLAEVGGEDA